MAFSKLGYLFIVDRETIIKPWLFEILSKVILNESPNHIIFDTVKIGSKDKINDNFLRLSYCSIGENNFLSVVFDVGNENQKRCCVFFPVGPEYNFNYIDDFKKRVTITYGKLDSISNLPSKEESLRYRDIF